jgi:hypothetical protein
VNPGGTVGSSLAAVFLDHGARACHIPGLELKGKVQKKPIVYIIVKFGIFNGTFFPHPVKATA